MSLEATGEALPPPEEPGRDGGSSGPSKEWAGSDAVRFLGLGKTLPLLWGKVSFPFLGLSLEAAVPCSDVSKVG